MTISDDSYHLFTLSFTQQPFHYTLQGNLTLQQALDGKEDDHSPGVPLDCQVNVFSCNGKEVESGVEFNNIALK